MITTNTRPTATGAQNRCVRCGRCVSNRKGDNGTINRTVCAPVSDGFPPAREWQFLLNYVNK
jgi:hypothetical protein